MTTHPDDATLLSLQAGDLRVAEADMLRAHLAACTRCAAVSAGLEAAVARMHPRDPGPPPFVAARIERALFAQIAAGRRRPRLVPRRTAVIATLVAGLSGAALATGALRAFVSPRPETNGEAASETLTPREPPLRASIASPSATALPAPLSLGDSPVPSSGREWPLAPSPLRRRTQPPVSPAGSSEAAWQAALRAPGAANWLALAAAASTVERRTEAYVRALEQGGGAEAAKALRGLVREGAVAAAVVRERLVEAGGASAEGLRLRCEMGLLAAPDLATVQSCQLFGRRFPAHPAVWSLALAAGHVAETLLGDPGLAVGEYTRALQAAKYAPAAGGEALWRRARARATLGEREEAAADLRLYLHLVPTSRGRAEVSSLARDLGVQDSDDTLDDVSRRDIAH